MFPGFFLGFMWIHKITIPSIGIGFWDVLGKLLVSNSHLYILAGFFSTAGSYYWRLPSRSEPRSKKVPGESETLRGSHFLAVIVTSIPKMISINTIQKWYQQEIKWISFEMFFFQKEHFVVWVQSVILVRLLISHWKSRRWDEIGPSKNGAEIAAILQGLSKARRFTPMTEDIVICPLENEFSWSSGEKYVHIYIYICIFVHPKLEHALESRFGIRIKTKYDPFCVA